MTQNRYKKIIKYFVADLETYTNECQYFKQNNDTAAYLAVLVELRQEAPRVWKFGGLDTIAEFIKFLMSPQIEASEVFVTFHNLSFDASFIIPHLIKKGFTWTTERKLEHGQMSGIIDGKKIYGFSFYFRTNSFKRTINFRCSFLKMPMSIKAMGKAQGLEKQEFSPIQETIYETLDDIPPAVVDYCVNDAKIMIKPLFLWKEMFQSWRFDDLVTKKKREYPDNPWRDYTFNGAVWKKIKQINQYKTKYKKTGRKLKQFGGQKDEVEIDGKPHFLMSIDPQGHLSGSYPINFYDLAKLGYRGGFTSFNHRKIRPHFEKISSLNSHLKSEVKGTLNIRDFNASYGHAMTQKLPTSLPLLIKPHGDHLTYHLVKIFSAELKPDGLAVMPAKDDDGGLRYQLKTNRPFIMGLWDDELKVFLNNYTISYEILQTYFFECKDFLKEHIESFYTQRQNAKKLMDELPANSPEWYNQKMIDTTAKYGVNGGYGKFAMSPFQEAILVLPASTKRNDEVEQNNRWYRVISALGDSPISGQEVETDESYTMDLSAEVDYATIGLDDSNLQTIPDQNGNLLFRCEPLDYPKRMNNAFVASYITSFARCRLFEQLENHKDTWIYCDTDSIFTLENDQEYSPKYGENAKQELDNPNVLGAFKYEGDGAQFLLLQKKQYQLKNESGTILKSAYSGFKFDKDNPIDYWKIANGESVNLVKTKRILYPNGSILDVSIYQQTIKVTFQERK